MIWLLLALALLLGLILGATFIDMFNEWDHRDHHPPTGTHDDWID